MKEPNTAMTELVKRERSGVARNGTNREEVLQKVGKLRTARVDGPAWLDVHRAVLERKRVLIVEVLNAPTVFQRPRIRSRIKPWISRIKSW